MSWYPFRPYVSAVERRRKAEVAAKKLGAKSGRALAPVQLAGKKIASTFWGKAWCDNLESYSDYENRLPRGRSYVRSGAVIDLQISAGKVQAMVQGSSLYKVAITFDPLALKQWTQFKSRAAGKVTNLLDLLQGQLSKDILTTITARETGLFPMPANIHLDCSCPDWADMCKHVAAVLYGVGARLDDKPELFFTLRGVDMQELITAASAAAAAPDAGGPPSSALADSNLAEIFGVEIESTPPSATAKAKVKAKAKAKPAPSKSRKQKAKKKALR